jgi:hypothetical protein
VIGVDGIPKGSAVSVQHRSRPPSPNTRTSWDGWRSRRVWRPPGALRRRRGWAPRSP